MEPLAADLGKTFIEKLINGAIEKSRYLFCFNRIVKEFNEEKLKLEAERITMKERFKVATEKDKYIQHRAHFWEEQVDMLIQEDTKTKQQCFFGFCPDCIWRYKRGHDLAIKTMEIKQWMEKGDKLENFELDRPLPGVERYSSQYYISFKSRELKYEELLNALKDVNNYITGLYGMGGSGKTTLAKEVGKHLKAMKQFDHVIDTTVSNTPDIKKIQDDIAGSLGLKWEDCNESDRPKRLWSRLTDGEKILVILDDVWGDLNFDNIGIPNSDNHKGCKVLVTTRNLWVCTKMACQNTIQLELLTEEDAWTMFKMYAGINNNFSSKSFLNKGRKIAIECKGLPVAITTIARSLKSQNRQVEWDTALTSLQKHVSMAGVDNELVDIYKCLKFSYDNLKDERAKVLFLLCSLFEEDAEISVEFLTRLAIGVGIFGEYYSSYEDVQGQAMRAKNKLLDSCLLLETEEKNVKMHDMVRDVAQWIANKEIQRINFLNKNQKSLVERDKNIKYLFCEGKIKDLFSSQFDGSKLELLFVNMELFEFIDVPISFLKNIIGIRVLILIHNGVRKKLSLLQSIQSLMNIRTLVVQNVNLGDISALGNLSSLETLDLGECDIDNLPCEIEKLENLRLLNLQSCRIECNNPFEVIQNCSSLEVLYFIDSFNAFCKEITLPTTLQRYHLLYDFDIETYSLSKCVALDQDVFTEVTYKYVFETVEIIHLLGIEKEWRNLMPEIVPIEKGMNDLIELHLKSSSQLKFLVDTRHIDSQVPPNVFSKLVVLHLFGMENMETLGNGSISLDSLSNLEDLSIERCRNLRSLFTCSLNLCNLKTMRLFYCPNLVSVFDLSTSKSLLMLEKLVIIYCPKLENIFTNKEILVVDDNISFNPMFPKLKVFKIEDCQQLQFILPLLSSEGLLLLEDISIERCKSLKYIFGQHQQVEFASLTKLKLSDLPNFIDIFPESHHSTMSSSISKVASKSQTQLEPKKSSMFSWSHMCCYGNKLRDTTTNTNLPLVSEDQQQQSSIIMVSNLNCLAECFSRSISTHIMCNIKEIFLWSLPKTMSVFILSIATIMSLESLTIGYCNKLKHIIVDIGSGGGNIVFPKFKMFEVFNCKKLEYIFGHIGHDDDHQEDINEAIIHLHFPALEHLKFHHLPSLMGMSTKKYCTTFPALTKVELFDCSKLDIKFSGDFSSPNNLCLIAQESTTIKKLSENMEHFISLKHLSVEKNSKLESIFYFNELNDKKIRLTLEDIVLHFLPMMICPFVGPRDTFTLQNLTRFQIMGCEKLKSVFPTSIIQYLPHLESISIEECNELMHIIEDDDDLENKKEMSRTCFPKLSVVIVIKCNKLKSVFPISVCKELPELRALAIREAKELDKIFKSDDKVEIPNLNIVLLVNLPSLLCAQRIHFQAVENRSIQNCPKLSLTSALTLSFNATTMFGRIGDKFKKEWNSSKKFMGQQRLTEQQQSLGEIDTVIEPSHGNNNIKMKQTLEAEHEFDDNLPNMETDSKGIEKGFEETTSTHFELGSSSSTPLITFESKTSSNDLMDQQCLNEQQQSLGEIDTVTKPSHENNNIKMRQTPDTENEFVDRVPNLEIPTNSKELMNERSKDQQHPLGEIDNNIKHSQSQGNNNGIEKGSEEGTTSTHFELGSSSSTPFIAFESKTSSHEDGNDQIDMTIEKNDEVSLNDDAIMKVNSKFEEHSSMDGEVTVSKSNAAPIITSSIEAQFPSIPSQEEPSEIVEDLSSFLFVTRELEQLVSKKYLDHENLSLLIDFLVKHPTVLLRDTSLSNRYKGYAYNCLAELLKFLQTHSVSDVLGSSHSEFVEILQDAHKFPFDNDWLNDVEKRAMFPGLQVSKAALQKLLDSKHILTQHVEDLKNQLTSSEAILDSIIQQEAHILETRATLSDPIGY